MSFHIKLNINASSINYSFQSQFSIHNLPYVGWHFKCVSANQKKKVLILKRSTWKGMIA